MSTTAVSSSTSTSSRKPETTSSRPTTGQAAERAAGTGRSETSSATRDIAAVDARVSDSKGESVRGYGLDLDGDRKFDSRKDGVLGFDFDRNGQLNGQEIRDSRAALDAFAGNSDANGDGKVTAEEAEQGKRLAALVQKFDANGDGKLGNGELKAAGALVQVDGKSLGIDDLPVDGQSARLKSLDPLNYGAQLETGKAGEAQAAGKDDKAAGESKGSSSPKGPTEMNPDAPTGFLWKPSSESDGNLVVLLPPNMTGKVAQVNVLSPEGQVLATGKPSGVANGGREHFRFNQPGNSFPSGVKVQIVMKDGSTREISIPNPGVRNEGSGK